MFLRQILPISSWHVVELFAWVQTLTDADGLEIGAPEVLQQVVIAAEYFVIEFAIGERERHSRLVLKGDADGRRLPVVVIAIMAMGVVDEPRLVVETVMEMPRDEGKHVVVG